MTKLLLLLFIPFVSFSQDLDFNDIKQIDSEKQFKRVMFENGFVNLSSNDHKLSYAYDYDHSSKEANVFAYHFNYIGIMEFNFAKNSDNSPNAMFIKIFEQVKSECTFYDFRGVTDFEYACYTCPNSKYKGKIGFRRGVSVFDYIETFDF